MADKDTAGLRTVGAGFGDAFSKVDFGWNESGQIELSEIEEVSDAETTEKDTKVPDDTKGAVGDATGETVEGADEGESKGAEGDGEGEGVGDTAGSDEIEALKEEMAALREQLKTKEKTPEDQTGATDQRTVESLIPEDRDIVDLLSDKETGVKFLKDLFQVQIDPLVDSLRPMVIQWRVHNEAVKMIQDHGEDFTDRLPLIKTLVQKRPDLTMKQAYDLVKEEPLPKKSTAKTGQVEATDGSAKKETVTDSVDAVAEAKAIAEKAAQLKTEQGVAGSQEKGRATTVRAALNDAIDEHFS